MENEANEKNDSTQEVTEQPATGTELRIESPEHESPDENPFQQQHTEEEISGTNDFQSSSKEEMVNHLSHLLKEKEIGDIISEVRNLRQVYEDGCKEAEKKALGEYLQAGGFEAMFTPPKDPLDSKFRELINVFEDRRKKFLSEKKTDEKQNLHIKEQVIDELKKLIAEEDRIGKAFQRFKELQDQWQKSGEAPLKKRRQLEAEYHFQVELFYYNIKINKDLKDLDLQKHLEEKTELLRKINGLLENKSIKQVEAFSKQYREEWASIGPVPKNEKDRIISEFNEATRKVFRKIKDHYESVRKQQADNLAAKISLCEKVEVLNTEEIDSLKKWNQKTKDLLAIQDEWKKTGFAGKVDTDKVWERFRKACNEFFEKKKLHFEDLKKNYDDNAQKKTALCEKAESLKDDKDWEKTTEFLIGLQRQWKNIGPANHKDDNKLWNRFRTACDYFFESKKIHALDVREEEKQMLLKKQEFLQRLDQTVLTGDAQKDMEALKNLEQEWLALGDVPRRDAPKVHAEYARLLDQKYEQVNIGGDEREMIKFRNKIDRLKHAEDSSMLLQREKKFLQDQLQKAESSIIQYENNLGFFAKSGKADFLKKEVEKNVTQAKEEIKILSNKLKILKSAMKDFPESAQIQDRGFVKKDFKKHRR